MTDDQVAAVMARTDAAVGLLLAVLIEKGVVSELEMNALLDKASDLAGTGTDGAIVATVFMTLKILINNKTRIANVH
jgi:hypothetical protein